MSNNKPLLVELYNLCSVMGAIIEYPSNIVWSNQTGGTCCSHPKVEGIYIPIRMGDPPDADILLDLGYREYDPELVTEWLANNALDHWFETRDHYDGGFFGEAWVPVKLLDKLPYDPHFKPFAGMNAVITYENSD